MYVLPIDHPGYIPYRDCVERMVVLGEGRRGKGNIILGPVGTRPDLRSPLSHVVAYGVLETQSGDVSVTVRELVEDQLDVEIVPSSGDNLPAPDSEKRRWTYSSWTPGSLSPKTGDSVREITISENIVLVAARSDQRLWVHDVRSGMNILLPITGFYTELMSLRRIREPALALNPGRFYAGLEGFSDEELRNAFLSYNKMYPKVDAQVKIPTNPVSWWKHPIRRLLGQEKRHG
jgi:hypothetical protein